MSERLLEKVRYVSKGIKNLRLLMTPTREELVTDGNTGNQTKYTHPGRWIVFEESGGFEYSTDDPVEVKFLDNHSACTGLTRTGKVAKIRYERALPEDKVQNEFLDLVREFGRDNVVAMLRKQSEKLQNVPPPEEEEDDEDEDAIEKARAALEKAKKRYAKAKKSGDSQELKKAKSALKKAEKAITELEVQLTTRQAEGG